ncbi:hypothetical protein CP082626L3_0771B, partial [Chlamydia psittaci 08-2626_L3]
KLELYCRGFKNLWKRSVERMFYRFSN